MCGGPSINYAEQEAKAKVAAAAEAARVKAEQEAANEEANKKLLDDKQSAADAQSAQEQRQKSLLALTAKDEEVDKPKTQKNTLLGG